MKRDPLWWFMRRWERGKYSAHVRIRMARQRRDHQRFVRLSIRTKMALAMLNEWMAEWKAAEQELATEITNPQALLDKAR